MYFSRCFLLAMLIALFGVWVAPCLAQQATADTDSVHIRPTVVIPFMKTPPTIDGVIEDGEWNTLHLTHFLSQSNDFMLPVQGEYWVGSDGKMIYIAVRTALNPQLGLWTFNTPTKGLADAGSAYFLGDWDDCLRLEVANNPFVSDKGEFYEVAINPLGALVDAMSKNSDQIRLSAWRGKYKFANKVVGNIWTIELAIDPKPMNITNLRQQLGIEVYHKYNAPWNIARWAPNSSWDSPQTFPLVRFTDDAPIVSELNYQNEQGIDIALQVTNPTTKALPLTVKLGYNPVKKTREYKTFDVVLQPGVSQRFDYIAPFENETNYQATGLAQVSAPDGTIYYIRDLRWETKPAPFFDKNPYDPGVREFAIEWHPTPQLLRWRLDLSSQPNHAAITKARVIVIDQKTGKQVAQQTISHFTAGPMIQKLAIPTLATGRYEAQLYLDTNEVANKPISTHIFDQCTDFPWINNNIGISDEVIPPFTPLTVKGKTVNAILRQHVMTDTGLWAQVVAKDNPILVAPMRLEVKQGGKIQTINATLQFSKTKPNQVIAQADWRAGSLRGHTVSDFDYDGCMKVTIQLSQVSKKKIESMELVIPLDAQQASLMHVCGDSLRCNYAGKVPAGNGIVWTSADASKNNLLGTFIPYLWVGGPERGLCWFASNDRDWVVDFSDKVPDLALVRKGNTLELRVRLIQQPTIFSRTHTIVFGLQATPTKPLPEQPNWRLWGPGAGGEGKFDWSFVGMSTYYGCPYYSIRPLNDDYQVIREAAISKHGGPRNDKFWEEYVAKHPEWKAELNAGSGVGHANAAVPYTNLRGDAGKLYDWSVYQDEWRITQFCGWGRQTEYQQPLTSTDGGAQDFVITFPKSRQDYLMYYYREMLKNGFDSFYWDNSNIYANENPISGNAFVREDGEQQRSADIWELREVMKRTAVLEHQMGKPNANVVHMTNAFVIPAHTWAAYNLDWEWKYGTTDFQDRVSCDYIQAASMARQAGLIPVILSGINPWNAPNAPWVERTRTGVLLVHEMDCWGGSEQTNKIKRFWRSLGYGTPSCQVFNYWEKNPVVQVSGTEMPFLALKCRDQVVILLTDYGNGGTCKVKLDLNRLGLAPNFTATNWENDKEQLVADNDTLTLTNFKKHDFRMLVIPRKQ